MPYMPRFEIVNVPPSRSGSLSLPSRAGDDVRAIVGDLLDGLALGVADDRDDEAARSGNREPDVRRGETVELPVDEVGIDCTVSDQCRGDEAREHVRDRRLRLPFPQQLDHELAGCDSSVASAVTVSWKTGAAHASVSRRAIVWRVFVSSTTSNSGAATARLPRPPGAPPLLDVLGDHAAFGPGA